MNTAKLKGKMREYGVTQEVLAKQMGIALSTLNRKLQDNGEGEAFSVKEANEIKRILNLTEAEAVSIFLAG